MDARLICDAPASGAWNMALDEALLRSACARREVTVRFYQWREPTLSLGYFQSHRDRERDPRLAALPFVRRSTGGGAILHDRELTYSLVAPIRDRLGDNARQFVVGFHEELVATLNDLEVPATLCTAADTTRIPKPFLCFERHEPLDILLGRHKVVGSAQRRHHGALLQHGSILLHNSPLVPELLGLDDLAPTIANDLSTAWLVRLARRFGWRFQETSPAAEEVDWAREFETGQYAAASWNRRR